MRGPAFSLSQCIDAALIAVMVVTGTPIALQVLGAALRAMGWL